MLTIKDVVEAKAYVKNGISYMLPKDIISPFIDTVSEEKDEIVLTSQGEVVNENEDETRNISYPRMLVEVRKESIEINETSYQAVFGLLYAMDLGTPILKTFFGYNASACTNMCIFNANQVIQRNLLSKRTDFIEDYKAIADKSANIASDFKEITERLDEIFLTRRELSEFLGYGLRSAITENKLPLGILTGAVKNMANEKSPYYVQGGSYMNNVVQSMTQVITDSKNITSKIDNTIAVYQLAKEYFRSN